jgi:hypothetical protein
MENATPLQLLESTWTIACDKIQETEQHGIDLGTIAVDLLRMSAREFIEIASLSGDPNASRAMERKIAEAHNSIHLFLNETAQYVFSACEDNLRHIFNLLEPEQRGRNTDPSAFQEKLATLKERLAHCRSDGSARGVGQLVPIFDELLDIFRKTSAMRHVAKTVAERLRARERERSGGLAQMTLLAIFQISLIAYPLVYLDTKIGTTLGLGGAIAFVAALSWIIQLTLVAVTYFVACYVMNKLPIRWSLVRRAFTVPAWSQLRALGDRRVARLSYPTLAIIPFAYFLVIEETIRTRTVRSVDSSNQRQDRLFRLTLFCGSPDRLRHLLPSSNSPPGDRRAAERRSARQ